MKNKTRHAGKLEIIERLPNSVNGNPRYLCRIDGWTCRTTPDSSLAYSITNWDGKHVSAIIGSHYGLASIADITDQKGS
jgi:hypothetical protein